MFGFLPAPCGTCRSADHDVYRSYFCGLSSALARDYGAPARFFTNRDGAFFSILAASQMRKAPRETLTTCCNPLGKKKVLKDVDAHASFAAAVSVCGVYTKLKDDAEDETGVRKHLSAFGSTLIQRNVDKASSVLNQYGFPTRQIRGSLDNQGMIEAQSNGKWDICASTTANAYGKIFEHTGKLAQAQPKLALQKTGQTLGRIIYLVDAYEDRVEDEVKGRFNPILKTSDSQVHKWFEKEYDQLLTDFRAIEINRHSQLLNSIIVDGLYSKSMSVLGMAGSSSGKKKKKSGQSNSCWDNCCHCDSSCCDCDGCCPCDCS